jgi:hypothetical protein
LGGGSILTGLVLGAIGAFVIDKKFVEASAFAFCGAVLTFFGFMHGESGIDRLGRDLIGSDRQRFRPEDVRSWAAM